MKRFGQFVLCIILATATHAQAGEVIDRIIATVNRGIVLQSDLEVALRFEALQANRAVSGLTNADAAAAMNRLIDQRLLLQEMGNGESIVVDEADIRQRMDDLRKQFPQAANDESWRMLLRGYGLTEEDVADQIRTQVEILRFVEMRLRPNVRIEESDILAYYQNELLPKLKQALASDPPLADVRRQIRQVLVERRVDQLLDVWLKNLREQGTIHTDMKVGENPVVVGRGDSSENQ